MKTEHGSFPEPGRFYVLGFLSILDLAGSFKTCTSSQGPVPFGTSPGFRFLSSALGQGGGRNGKDHKLAASELHGAPGLAELDSFNLN